MRHAGHTFEGLLGIAVGVVLVVGCRSPQRPDAPPRPATPVHELAAAADREAVPHVPLDSGPPALRPYLEQYPLGTLGRRRDLLAVSPERSLHLVQLALPLPPHTHPARKELAYVLTGRGVVRIGDREYPAAPGAAFRIDAGTPHSVHPDEGETLVAIVYYEPPLPEGDDSVPAR